MVEIMERLDLVSEDVTDLQVDVSCHFALMAKAIGIVASGLPQATRQRLIDEFNLILKPMYGPGSAAAELVLERIECPDGWNFPGT